MPRNAGNNRQHDGVSGRGIFDAARGAGPPAFAHLRRPLRPSPRPSERPASASRGLLRRLVPGLSVDPGSRSLRSLGRDDRVDRSEEHTSELPSLMRTSYAVLCVTKNIDNTSTYTTPKTHLS